MIKYATVIAAFISVLMLMLCACAQTYPYVSYDDVFSLNEYEYELNVFAVEHNVGELTTENQAIEAAKRLWEDKFGEVNGKPYDLYENKVLKVAFDNDARCWHIWLEFARTDVLGSAPHVIIRNDGDVLALWMG